MIQRLILHIGRHKTGTSAIQLYLAAHRAAFAAEGIAIPSTGGFRDAAADPADKVAHHRIAEDFGLARAGDKARRQGWLAEIEAASQGAETIVLSSELFQNANDFLGLRELAAGRHVEVVCYLREYLDYALSAWAQEVKKTGLAAGFFEFERGFNPQIARFCRAWQLFANRCHWRLYDPGADVVADFLSVTGLPDPGGRQQAAGAQRTNPRLGGSLLGFKLLANGAGLHSLALAQALEPLAAARQAWRRPLRLAPDRQAALRTKDYNAELEALFGELPLRDFSDGAWPFESPDLAKDFAEILAATAEFPAIQRHPLFRPFLETAMLQGETT
ncbi:hypothetical protein [Pseudoroseicyclus sp. CXY001]|uniref:hypothetical protein n=1 Tax=Pseudoroseicyclus sp. CXY001 TaxID=3242492 RepID=UPI0035717045